MYARMICFLSPEKSALSWDGLEGECLLVFLSEIVSTFIETSFHDGSFKKIFQEMGYLMNFDLRSVWWPGQRIIFQSTLLNTSLGGGVAEWLELWTCNPEVFSGRLDLFHGSPVFKPSAALVNSQLESLPPVGVFKMFMSHLSYYFLLFTVSSISTAVLNTTTLK